MADLKRLAENAAMLGGTPLPEAKKSGFESGLQKQFFAEATRQYAQEAGAIASNCFEAECQGLNGNNFAEYRKVLLRSAPVTVAGTGELMPDDWQRITIIKPAKVTVIPPGAYLRYGGNTWIVYKGKNMGSVLGNAIVRRCNSVINTLDWYGNIVSVPMSFAKMGTQGNASHASENSIVAKNYMDCVCQLNEISSTFRENTRIILGKAAYGMRGLNDFTRSFTDEQDSVHLLTFTIERSEPLEQDSLEKQCADYHSFSWEIMLMASRNMKTGGTQQIQVSSLRMGLPVESSEEHPISYLFSSSDESVAAVDESGTVTALKPGNAEITVTLAQNPDIRQTLALDVAEGGGDYVDFTCNLPDTLSEYRSITISAAWFSGGEETEDEVSFRFAGPAGNAYSATITGKNRYTISCFAASTLPLTIYAEAHGQGVSAKIWLTA